VAGLPRLLAEIVEGLVRAEPGLEFLGTFGSLPDAARSGSLEADAFVVGPALGDADEVASRLLTRNPRARVLAIVADGREGSLYELQPQRTDLDELSPAQLVGALRGRIGRI
jgi:hypothetical protein